MSSLRISVSEKTISLPRVFTTGAYPPEASDDDARADLLAWQACVYLCAAGGGRMPEVHKNSFDAISERIGARAVVAAMDECTALLLR